tara:strand:- start:1358 stop:2104 length:747 start_codon:yes stop_codon:yes gene_type:complete
MKILKKLKDIFKKNKTKMNTERLISLKENFTGQTFQWIKTQDPNLLGKVVKCKDVEPKGRGYMAYFNDGSSIDAEKLNRNLMMITDGMQPLSKAEVQGIARPVAPPVSNETASGAKPIQMPDHLKEFATPAGFDKPIAQPKTLTNKPPSAVIAAPTDSNMFSMFNADETSINISVKLKLPNKKLLKLMYENADNKDKFLKDLSEYVYSKINKNIVGESLKASLVPVSKKPPVKEKKTEVTATEVPSNG